MTSFPKLVQCIFMGEYSELDIVNWKRWVLVEKLTPFDDILRGKFTKIGGYTWTWIADKFAKFHAKRLNRSENISKSFRGLLFWNTRFIQLTCTITYVEALEYPKILTQTASHQAIRQCRNRPSKRRYWLREKTTKCLWQEASTLRRRQQNRAFNCTQWQICSLRTKDSTRRFVLLKLLTMLLTDTKHRAASLRQQIYHLLVIWDVYVWPV